MTTVSHGMPTPPIVTMSLVGMTPGKLMYTGPFQISAAVSMMKLTPMAVISGASRGACLRGR